MADETDLSRWVGQFRSVKLGPGIAGKLAYITVAALVVLVVLAARIDTADRALVLALVVAVLLVLLIAIIGIVTYAWRRPGPSLLEGSELIAWQQAEYAAKGKPVLPRRGAAESRAALPPSEEIPAEP